MRSADAEEAAEAGSSDTRRRRRLRIWLQALGFPLVALLLAFGLPLASPLFPADEMTSCTIEQRERGRRDFMPKVASDCGTFVVSGAVPCSSDPSRTLRLIRGYTYDLVVRGPRIPLPASPVVHSATVSAEQKHGEPDYSELFDSPASSPALEELEQRFSPETLHAFDYEQPPFDPDCEVSRSVMTSIGIQHVSPGRAETLLAPPEGVTPREPLLPCEGYHCDPVRTSR